VPGGGGHETPEDGRSGPDGEARDGAHQAIVKHPGHPEGRLPRAGEGPRAALSHAELKCLEDEPDWAARGEQLIRETHLL